ncbi:hypothetical protein JKP76_09080 [Blastococcus sp. TML/C7B]|uniref:hypothetical protein n=1 Tax=Blastococcus sp. TML/C7B TaxID=2798728 RepID=UPI00190CA46A|nr:hypothetical protein [Blastococcus sp. TML/C7B]MBN1096172.1 hypothetical protein [Blastococcus sp. TML/C7B]
MRRLAVLAGTLACLATSACTAADGAPPEAAPDAGPAACLDPAEATRGSVEGTPVWARFCPGPERHLLPAEVPSDALTSHLELLAGLAERDAEDVPAGWPCHLSSYDEGAAPLLADGRTYEVQIGYADGGVTTIVGATDPDCVGRFPGTGAGVGGPDGLGVYGLLMTAFGRQYADRFEDAPAGTPLVCPEDPEDPSAVDRDGASASLDTGYAAGMRAPMVLPLTAVRGIVCTWSPGSSEPVLRELTEGEAERVRIGMHGILGAIADCGASEEPVHTAVVEDRTGTRRAVTVDDGNCSSVVRGGPGQRFGLGFPWLDR